MSSSDGATLYVGNGSDCLEIADDVTGWTVAGTFNPAGRPSIGRPFIDKAYSNSQQQLDVDAVYYDTDAYTLLKPEGEGIVIALVPGDAGTDWIGGPIVWPGEPLSAPAEGILSGSVSLSPKVPDPDPAAADRGLWATGSSSIVFELTAASKQQNISNLDIPTGAALFVALFEVSVSAARTITITDSAGTPQTADIEDVRAKQLVKVPVGRLTGKIVRIGSADVAGQDRISGRLFVGSDMEVN